MNPKHLLAALAVAAIPALAAAGAASPRTFSLTFTVNSTADTVDANPGDGVCMDANGKCTLRAAIMEANPDGEPDTLVFASSTAGTPIVLTLHGPGENNDATGDLDILDDLTITGNGTDKTIIDGDAADRVFDVNPLQSAVLTVEIDDLTVQNGNGVTDGGGLRVLASTLDLTGDLIQNNTAQGQNGTVDGGGVYANNSAVTLDHTTLKDNTASSGAAADGGGVAVDISSVLNVIDGSLVTGNIAQGGTSDALGGGVAVIRDSTLAMDSSAVRDNESIDTSANISAYGGGIADFANVTGGAYLITNSEISGNGAHGDGFAGGGGIETEQVAIDSALVNTTIAGNSAIADNGYAEGGGIELFSTASGVTESLDNVTISGNSVDAAGGGGGGLNVYSNQGMVSLQNTLVAGNQDASATAPDCFGDNGGTITSDGYNLIGDGTGCPFMNAGGDHIGTGSDPVDPKLGALADNGGPTKTMALLAGSPAVDAGNQAGCTDAAGNPLTTDQRGSPRPTDGNADGTAICDIGAYERAADHPPSANDGSVTTIENQSAGGTLKASDPDGDALTYAVATQPAHGTVTVNDASKGTFTYTPAKNYTGSDSFTFAANDGFVDSNAATESVTVNASSGGGGSGGGGAFDPFALLGLALVLMIWRWRHRCTDPDPARPDPGNSENDA